METIAQADKDRCGALTDPHAWTSSAIGPMPASVEVKLIDCAELSYFTAANPPQGEVFIRGGAVTEGYLNNAEENARAFEDGWFKTGDIGEFDRDGRLKIIDRRKNLVKTLNGEYIALEKVMHSHCSACTFGSRMANKPRSSNRDIAPPDASPTSASTHRQITPVPSLSSVHPSRSYFSWRIVLDCHRMQLSTLSARLARHGKQCARSCKRSEGKMACMVSNWSRM
jgi:hypothetical protein